eukprot:13835261-Alexandrium_andersonii.AAC.1
MFEFGLMAIIACRGDPRSTEPRHEQIDSAAVEPLAPLTRDSDNVVDPRGWRGGFSNNNFSACV